VHQSSYEKVEAFVATYLGKFRDEPLKILDVGSQTVLDQDLSYRMLFDARSWNYTGLDVESGGNVDVVLVNPYQWGELTADSFDVVVSGQAFEHIGYFWATAFEIGRVLRPGGVAVITAPGSGPQHRYPVDCWRIRDDGFIAIAEYLDFDVLDVFTDWNRNVWEDSIIVMRKPIWTHAERHRFATRLWHQRSLSAETVTVGEIDPLPDLEYEPPASSPLRNLVGGRLTSVLEELRISSITEESARREAAKPRYIRLIPEQVRRTITRIILRVAGVSNISLGSVSPPSKSEEQSVG
jgi:SAM-dependent methyltransferase